MIKYRKFSSYWSFHSRLNQASLIISFISDNDNSTWNTSIFEFLWSKIWWKLIPFDQHKTHSKLLVKNLSISPVVEACCSCSGCASCSSCGNCLNIMLTLPGETWKYFSIVTILVQVRVQSPTRVRLDYVTILNRIWKLNIKFKLKTICLGQVSLLWKFELNWTSGTLSRTTLSSKYEVGSVEDQVPN